MTLRAPLVVPASPPAPTLDEARRHWAEAFRGAGLDSPDLDARLLVGHALRLDHTGLVAAAARALTPGEAQAIEALARRRLAYEPVARIRGSKEFWGLQFQVTADTLVPRPETETVVETALAAVAATGSRGARGSALRILDLGTGSGAILVALLTELKDAIGVGTDISASALSVARRNACALGVGDRGLFVCCDLGAALGGRFDLIVANPPYIATADIAGLPADVRDFDPRTALDGGADGLCCYRAIAAAAPSLLSREGVLVVELGAGQAGSVAHLFEAAGLVPGAPRADLSGVLRVLSAGFKASPPALTPA
jgi:release factor glutamine methyltransferase